MPTRSENGQTWTDLTVTCNRCQTAKEFTRQQIARGDAQLEMTPCHYDRCTVMLCHSCDQFQCEGCGLAHCADHLNIYSYEGVHFSFCPICFGGAEKNDRRKALVLQEAKELLCR